MVADIGEGTLREVRTLCFYDLTADLEARIENYKAVPFSLIVVNTKFKFDLGFNFVDALKVHLKDMNTFLQTIVF